MIGLLQYGKPRVSYVGEGWYASVEMNTPALGTNFTVASDFSNPSPLSAARQCAERVQLAMKMYGK